MQMRDLIRILEDNRPQGMPILVIVHPGSACGSADFNLGDEADEDRAKLVAEISNWQGGVIVIKGDLDDELRMPRYQPLQLAISRAMRRAKASGLVAIRASGPDPKQAAVIARIVQRFDFNPKTTTFRVTGAWYHPDDETGCVGDVAATLRRMGYDVEVGDAMRL